MARRDRRRGGAHSAPRKSRRSSAPSAAPDANVDGDSQPEATAPDDPSPPPPPSSLPSSSPESAATDLSSPNAGAEEGGGNKSTVRGEDDPEGPSDAPGPGPVGTGAGRAGGVLATDILAADFSSADLQSTSKRRKPRWARRSAKKGKGRHKRSWLDRFLLAGVIVVALALLAVGTGYAYLQYRFDQVTKVTVKHLTKAPVGQPFNVLLIGSDSRVNVSAADQSHFGNQSAAGGQRSDVVKIVHIIPATGQVSVLSIPRDTVVSVAGNISQIGKYNRINATYNTGPDQLVQTIELNFGIPIEHVVQINFEGFRGAVDAIGGINLNFPYPATDTYTGLNIQQTGCQHVNGGYSLAVARSRHYEYKKNGYWQYDGTSDFGRIQRQNAFLRAVINQAETRYNPLTLNAFIGSVVQGVTIDSTFTVSDLISLAQQFHTFASQALATATLPAYSSGSSAFGYLGSVLYVQQPQAEQVITQFLGQAPDPALTPPPSPSGVVTTTTTTSTIPSSAANPTHGSTPSTSTSTSTTTTIETDFDPTPC